jgi:hypothetical protein
MALPPGYRFFRDDALLEIREKETLYCERCDQLYWKTDEERTKRAYKSKGSYVGDNLCPNCIQLIRSRVYSLQHGNRRSCPIEAGKWIYAKHHHTVKNEKDYFAKAKESYDWWEEYYKGQEAKAKTIAELKFKMLLKKEGD